MARQHLNRAGSTSLAELSDEEKRAKVLGMFSSISNSSAWRTGTGTGLMKEQITEDHQGGPGASCCFVFFHLTGRLLCCCSCCFVLNQVGYMVTCRLVLFQDRRISNIQPGHVQLAQHIASHSSPGNSSPFLALEPCCSLPP